MSRAKWKTDPICGLTRKQMKQLPEELLNNDGTFKPAAFPDCNIFDVRTIAAEAGYKQWRYFKNNVLINPSSPFHTHAIKTESGEVVGHATHTMSAECGGKVHRAATLAAQTGEPITDVSSGSNEGANEHHRNRQ